MLSEVEYGGVGDAYRGYRCGSGELVHGVDYWSGFEWFDSVCTCGQRTGTFDYAGRLPRWSVCIPRSGRSRNECRRSNGCRADSRCEFDAGCCRYRSFRGSGARRGRRIHWISDRDVVHCNRRSHRCGVSTWWWASMAEISTNRPPLAVNSLPWRWCRIFDDPIIAKKDDPQRVQYSSSGRHHYGDYREYPIHVLGFFS